MFVQNMMTDVQTSEQDGVGAHHAPELGEADDAVPVPVHHLQHLLSLLTIHCRTQTIMQVYLYSCLSCRRFSFFALNLIEQT